MSGFTTKCPTGAPDVDRALAYVATDWVMVAFMVIAVALRIYSRGFLTRSFGSDDASIILATLLVIAGSVTDSGAHAHGFGRHCAYLSEERLAQTKKWISAQWLVAFCCFFMIRTSVMLFTLRLLPRTKRKSAWAIYAAFALNIAIFLIAIISYALQCRPFSAIWNENVRGTCVSLNVLAITNQVNAVLAVVIDITTACIPAFLLWGVQMRRRTKTTLHIVFCLGLLTAALSIGRASTVSRSAFAEDLTWNIVDAFWFSIWESKLGIVVASAPAMRQANSYYRRTKTLRPTSSRQRSNQDFDMMRHRINFRDWVRRGKRDPARAGGILNGDRMVSYDKFGSETRFEGGSIGSKRGPFGATDPEDSPLMEAFHAHMDDLKSALVKIARESGAILFQWATDNLSTLEPHLAEMFPDGHWDHDAFDKLVADARHDLTRIGYEEGPRCF